MGGSGPVNSIVRSSISWAATAASTCSTVWMVVSPLPIAVRRSTASTSDRRAGTSGLPARSTRRNTIPCPAGAGKNAASVRAPVCNPVPEMAAFFLMLRLALGLIGPPYERLEVVHDLGQAVQRPLRPQEFAMRARWVARHGGTGVDVSDDASLDRDAGAAPDRHVVREPRLAREEYVVLDVRAARDTRLPGDEAARADPTVVPDLDQVVDLRPQADHSVVHTAAVDRGVRANLHVVADDAAAHLGNLARYLPVFAGHVAEPIRAEPHAGVQDHALPHDGPAVADDLGKQLRVVAQHRALPDAHVAAEPHPASQYGVRADRHWLLPHDARAQHGRTVDPGLPGGLRVECGDDREQRHVRVAHQDAAPGPRRRLRRQVRFTEHDGRARPLKILEIASGSKKRQVIRTGAVERCDTGDRDVRGAHQLTLRERGDLARAEATGSGPCRSAGGARRARRARRT